MSTPTIETVKPESEGGYCSCWRSGDQWACQSRDEHGPRRCDPLSGKDCALNAIFSETGRDVSNAGTEAILTKRPCRCGGKPR